jgi:hypothetical protein
MQSMNPGENNFVFRRSGSVVLASQIQRSTSVFTDLGSISALQQQWEHIPTSKELEYEHASAQSLASGIESLVLYDAVCIDSLFLEVRPNIESFFNELDGIAKGVYLDELTAEKTSFRSQAASGAEHLIGEQYDNKLLGEVRSDDLRRAESEDLSYDKYGYEDYPSYPCESAHVHLIPHSIDTFLQDQLNHDLMPLGRRIPHFAKRSMHTLPRAIFYQELTRLLQIPYSPGRNRAQVLASVSKSYSPGLSQTLMKQAAAVREERSKQPLKALLGTNDVPELYQGSYAVPDLTSHILKRCVRRGVPLGEMIMEVRNSRNAKNFRGFCGELCATLLASDRKVEALNAQLAGIKKIVDLWAEDLDEGIVHRRHTVNFKDVWGVGKILEAVGLEKVSVKDPILSMKEDLRGLLLINDVLRSPTAR